MSNRGKFATISTTIKTCLKIGLFVQSAAFVCLAARDTRQQDGSGNGGRSNSWASGGSSELDSWNYWWSYSGVSGPAYWGLLNADWFMCDKGRRQSPVNIDTRYLVYDPFLDALKIDNNLISGILHNDGHSIVLNGSLAAAAHSVIFAKSELLDKKSNEQDMQKANGSQVAPAKRASELAIFSQLVLSPSTDGRPSLALMKDLSQSDRFIEMTMSDDDNQAPLRREANDAVADQAASSSAATAQQQQQQLEEQMQLIESRSVQFSGAGLAYTYRFETMHLRFGLDETQASEHRINGRSFGAELQLLAYNWQLYKSFAEASVRPHGLLGISVLIEPVSDKSGDQFRADGDDLRRANEQLEKLARIALSSLRYRANYEHLPELDLLALLPNLSEFVTYEGSLSWPGCHESVTWLLLNRPQYISKSSLEKLRLLSADEQSAAQSSGTLIAGNIRPVQPLNDRPIRTNIRPPTARESGEKETCTRLWAQYEYKTTIYDRLSD